MESIYHYFKSSSQFFHIGRVLFRCFAKKEQLFVGVALSCSFTEYAIYSLKVAVSEQINIAGFAFMLTKHVTKYWYGHLQHLSSPLIGYSEKEQLVCSFWGPILCSLNTYYKQNTPKKIFSNKNRTYSASYFFYRSFHRSLIGTSKFKSLANKLEI